MKSIFIYPLIIFSLVACNHDKTWSEYNNRKNNYSVSYPINWTIDTTLAQLNILRLISTQSSKEILLIVRDSSATNNLSTLNDAAKEVLNTIAEGSEVVTTKLKQINESTYMKKYSMNLGTENVTVTQIWFFIGHLKYEITYSMKKNDSEQLTINRILDSINIGK